MRIPLEEAAARLLAGDVVAVPTETVYGLAGSLSNSEAIRDIFRIKGRPANNPLIIHISHLDQLKPFGCQTDLSFFKLAAAFWPGPLTLVLPIEPKTILDSVRAGLQTAAFRMPEHPIALELIEKTGPLVMPSANLSGRPSSTSPDHVEADFGRNFPVLDGGTSACGVESTVMVLREKRWIVIRQGILVPEDFETVLGYIPEIDLGKKDSPICPGQLYRHYAPKCKLVLAKKFGPGIVLGYRDREYPQNEVMYLGSLRSPETIAESLYSTLRKLDEQGIEEAYVDMNFEEIGLMKTIGERLRKAAAH